MFRHIFYYRLLTGLRDKDLLFWTLLFPIILATLFNFAFGNLNSGETFSRLPIAVIENDAWSQDQVLQQVLKQVSEGEKALFELETANPEAAEAALLEDKLVGYLIPGETLEVVIRYSGLRQSMLKAFADEYTQVKSSIGFLLAENPGLNVNELFSRTRGYLADLPASSSSPDTTLVYYYALIAMACLYGGFWGLREVVAIKANLSARAARVNAAPVSKTRQFLYGASAAMLLHFISIILLLSFLRFIIGIDFGDQFWFILLASFIGSSLGVSFGALIGAVNNSGEGIKTAILIGFSMIMTFFAGLMVADMKYIVATSVPILRWLNPANLISDAFYSLYYYETLTRYWQNIGVMLIMQLLFAVIVFSIMRRQRYASI